MKERFAGLVGVATLNEDTNGGKVVGMIQLVCHTRNTHQNNH